ncbi:WD repeat-containing protein 3-like [Capsicum chacoense]
MVKAYLRYEPAACFGVIVSGESNIAFDKFGEHLIAPALDKICVWHTRMGECSKTLVRSYSKPSLAVVTCIASSPSESSSQIASGYAEGSIRIWDFEKGICDTTLNGHKRAVTALRYNKPGSLLASGGKDNDVILWDVVGETGLFRLRGHRDQVTDLVFLDSGRKLVTASKDKFLRVWDLDIQHCMQIISGHHTEIWSIDIDPEERYLVTGSADPELRFYTVKHDLADGQLIDNKSEKYVNKELATENKWEVLKLFGEIQRQSNDRVATVRFNTTGNLLACQVAGKMVEVFCVLNESESKCKAKRRISRKKKKKVAKEGRAEGGTNPVVTAADIFKLYQTLRAGKKISSISFFPSKATSQNPVSTLALSLNNNLLEFHDIGSSSSTTLNPKLHPIELQGHRADIRSVTLSSNNTRLMSTSHNAIKIWNPTTLSCLHTIKSGYGLCGLFLPGNNYAVIGTKGGTLEFIDVNNGKCVEVVEAHGGSVHSIALTPDRTGFLTGSADHDIKFWEFQIVQKAGEDSKHLTASPTRSLKMNDDVLAIAVSLDGKFIVVALLDSTIKVFYMDSLKSTFSLYGHKLPVLCVDISSDVALLVSGSADKNVKIWDLGHGYCLKSLFAHADSVTGVKFVPNTHYFFTVGKDCLVKYWDADKFELLLTLEGHHAEVWCLAMSSHGDFIVTGSHDRSLRRWDRTEEPFFIEEEKEKRLEEMFESNINNAFENTYESKEEHPVEGAVALEGKKTQETLTATDVIIEALDMADAELKRVAEHQDDKSKGRVSEFRPNILMLGLSPSDYVLQAFSSVRTNDMEQALLALPFSDALKLLSYLENWASVPDKVELACKVATIIMQYHHHQLISTVSAKPLVTRLRDILHRNIKEFKDLIGYNLEAMRHSLQLISQRSGAFSLDVKTETGLWKMRSDNVKRIEARADTNQEKERKKKKQKSDGGHVWS